MPLKTYLIGLAGALALSVSPAAIAAAQQAPSHPMMVAQAEPADGNPDDAQAKRRKKLQEMKAAREAQQQGAPDQQADDAQAKRRQKLQEMKAAREAQQQGAPDQQADDAQAKRRQKLQEMKAAREAQQQGAPDQQADDAQAKRRQKLQEMKAAKEAQQQRAPDQQPDMPVRPPKPKAVQDGADQMPQATPDQKPRRKPPADQQAEPVPAEPARPRPVDQAKPDKAQPDTRPAPVADTPDVLKDSRPAGQLSDAELRARLDAARRQINDKSLPAATRDKLRETIETSRQEVLSRRKQPQPDQAGQPKPVDQAQPGQPKPADQARPDTRPEPVAGGSDVLNDGRPVGQLTDEELRARLDTARRQIGDKSLPAATRDKLRETIETSRKEVLMRRARAQKGDKTGQPVQPDQAGQTPLPGRPDTGLPTPVIANPRVDANAERQATALLADRTPAGNLSNVALRGRLSLYRDALAGGNLSPETQKALRQRLRDESQALRQRVVLQENTPPSQPSQPDQPGRPRRPPPLVVLPPTPQDIPGIIADRRQSVDLDERGLNRRILVYRDAINDTRYSDAERDYFRRYMLADRQELRRRMMDDRQRRWDELRWARDNRQLDVDIDVDLRPPMPNYRPVPTIWAAEVDDDAIEEQLIARPLRPLPQRYPRQVLMAQPETVVAQPEVRQAIPSVELDTIHFAFNDATVSEEEIANLDRIGRVLEKIVAAHPGEVFLIEGHTDAVGSDAANLDLSRRRAQSVKDALTEYYQISPDNLTTAGLGARYLKVRTPDAEPENRRVTIRRITSLVQN